LVLHIEAELNEIRQRINKTLICCFVFYDSKSTVPQSGTKVHRSRSAVPTVGDQPEVARVLCELGWTALATEDLPEARRWFVRALRAYDDNGSPREAAAGRVERAVQIVALAQAMSERAGVVVAHPMAPGISERIEALKAAVPQDALDALVASGRSLTPSEVMAMVME